jgi:hypothetical protein
MTRTIFCPEIESPYVDRDRDRFVASLVLGVTADETVESPRTALARAVHAVHVEAVTGDRLWCAYDSTTGERLLIHESEITEHAAPVTDPAQPYSSSADRVLDREAQMKVLAHMEEVAWGDTIPAIETVEKCLRLALVATSEDFLRWEQEAATTRGSEAEFDLSPTDVAGLSDDWRLAYVARLLRTLEIMYGTSYEFEGGAPGTGIYRHSPAELLHVMADAIDESIARRLPNRSGDR